MKIEWYLQKPTELSTFADEHNLVLEIHERWANDMRYFAFFRGCEVKSDAILSTKFGNGSTPNKAVRAYAENISGKLLVFNAMSPNRREIVAPALRFSGDLTLDSGEEFAPMATAERR